MRNSAAGLSCFRVKEEQFSPCFVDVSQNSGALPMTDDSPKITPANRVTGFVLSAKDVEYSQLDSQDIPAARARHSACVLGNYLYLYGGRCGHRVTREFWRFNLHSGVWDIVSSEGERPGLLEEHFMVDYNGAVFVFGYGVDQHNRSEIQVWNRPAEDLRWSRLHGSGGHLTIPPGRQSASATKVGHKLYVFGGFVHLYQSAVNELLEYDLELDSWKMVTRPGTGEGPSPLYGHTSISYEGCIYVFGGMAHQRSENSLWKFCLSNKFWISCPSRGQTPTGRYGHSAALVLAAMFVYGGRKDGVNLGDLWQYSLRSKIWSQISVEGIPPVFSASMIWLPKTSAGEVEECAENISFVRTSTKSKTYWRTISKEPLVTSSSEVNLGVDNLGVEFDGKGSLDSLPLKQFTFPRPWNARLIDFDEEMILPPVGEENIVRAESGLWDEVEMITLNGLPHPVSTDAAKKKPLDDTRLGQLLIIGGEENHILSYPKKFLDIRALNMHSSMVR